jgi:multimeric flavodoxin WrbA
MATNGSPDPGAFTSELPNISCAGINKPLFLPEHARGQAGIRRLRDHVAQHFIAYLEQSAMRVLGIAGSHHPGDATEQLVNLSLDVLEAEGMERSFFSLSERPVRACVDCNRCSASNTVRCAHEDSNFEDIIDEMILADGIIIGSPVLLSSVTPQTAALLDRAARVAQRGDNFLRNKVGAALVLCRHSAQNFALAQLNGFFLLNEMIVRGAVYPARAESPKTSAGGGDRTAEKVRGLAENVAWLLNKLHSRESFAAEDAADGDPLTELAESMASQCTGSPDAPMHGQESAREVQGPGR